jgi:hypothetical protein
MSDGMSTCTYLWLEVVGYTLMCFASPCCLNMVQCTSCIRDAQAETVSRWPCDVEAVLRHVTHTPAVDVAILPSNVLTMSQVSKHLAISPPTLPHSRHQRYSTPPMLFGCPPAYLRARLSSAGPTYRQGLQLELVVATCACWRYFANFVGSRLA